MQPVDTHLGFLRTFRLLSISSVLLFPAKTENTEQLSATFTGATQAVMSVRITNVLLSINAIFCYWENVWQWKEKYFTPSKVLCLVSGKCGCKAVCLWSLRQQVHFSVSDRLMHVQHQHLLPAFSWIPADFNPAIQSIYMFLFLSRRPLRKDASAPTHGTVLTCVFQFLISNLFLPVPLSQFYHSVQIFIIFLYVRLWYFISPCLLEPLTV